MNKPLPPPPSAPTVLKRARALFLGGLGLILLGALSSMATDSPLPVMLATLVGLLLLFVGLAIALVYSTKSPPQDRLKVTDDTVHQKIAYASFFEILGYFFSIP